MNHIYPRESFCCRAWGPATRWQTGPGWGDPAAGEQTHSSSCSPPAGHTAARHHWSCQSLWLRPARTDIINCVFGLSAHKIQYQHFSYQPICFPHADKNMCRTHPTHTYHCGLSDELSNQVFHACCPAVGLEIDLKFLLFRYTTSRLHIWERQKHD